MQFQSKFVPADLLDNVSGLEFIRNALCPKEIREAQGLPLSEIYFFKQQEKPLNYGCLSIHNDEQCLDSVLKIESFEGVLVEKETRKGFEEADLSALFLSSTKSAWLCTILLESTVRRLLRTFLAHEQQGISWGAGSLENISICSDRWANQEFWMKFLIEGGAELVESTPSGYSVHGNCPVFFRKHTLDEWLFKKERKRVESLRESFLLLFEKWGGACESQQLPPAKLEDNDPTLRDGMTSEKKSDTSSSDNIIDLNIYRTPTLQLIKCAFDELLFTGVVFDKKEEVRKALGKIIKRKGLENISKDQVRYIATILRPSCLQKGQNVSKEEIEEAKQSFLKLHNMKEFEKPGVFDEGPFWI